MPFASEPSDTYASWLAVCSTALAIVLVLAFIIGRRLVRARWFRVRDARVKFIRQHWEQIVSGRIPASEWFSVPMDRQIVEESALDRMDAPDEHDRAALESLFRNSGLLDRRQVAARSAGRPVRRHALLTLGRMRVPESLPVLMEALLDARDDVAVAAIRGLGYVATAQAGVAIIERLVHPLNCPKKVIESALFTCFQDEPEGLLERTLEAPDALRPLLARVLALVAAPDVPGDFLALAADPIADVRASAARLLAVARPAAAASALSRLAGDGEWFVRLRAMVALGSLADPLTITVLIQGLCDRNRLVRLRAAAALAAMNGEEAAILHLAMLTQDRYALQALISEMERSGNIARLVDAVAQESQVAPVESALLIAIRGGAVRFLVELAGRHPNPIARQRLMRILVSAKDPAILRCLERLQPEVHGGAPSASRSPGLGHLGASRVANQDEDSDSSMSHVERTP